jgi:hypothetical protein
MIILGACEGTVGEPIGGEEQALTFERGRRRGSSCFSRDIYEPAGGLVESQCARVLGDWRAWALWRRSCFRDLTDRRANCFGEGCVWSEGKCMDVGSGPRTLEYLLWVSI